MSYPVIRARGDYASVEIRDTGNAVDDPSNHPVVYQGAMATDQEFSGAEGGRLCAGRESIPGDATSPPGLWVCASGFSDIQVGESVVSYI